jgi:hypothetical protein
MGILYVSTVSTLNPLYSRLVYLFQFIISTVHLQNYKSNCLVVVA